MVNITKPNFDESGIEMIRAELASKWVTQCPMTERNEILISQNQNTAFAIACTSCTSALHLAALALDPGPGDDVFIPAFT